ncbi:MAG TPA: sigma-70 family RNA polymerase sigma factor [Terriglobia bacterium]
MTSGQEVTRLLAELRDGNQQARSELIALVYNELRRMAARYMRSERPGHTLQATALVHEAYLQIFKQQDVSWQNRAHFLAVAATTMRSILIDHARARSAGKRGGGQPRLSLEESLVFTEGRSEELLALDEALKQLAEFAPRESQIVELRYFGGLSVEETAEALQVSPRTVKRDWRRAQDWLYAQIKGHQE